MFHGGRTYSGGLQDDLDIPRSSGNDLGMDQKNLLPAPTQDRAEAKDYRDISAMLTAGISLEKALGAFAKMYRKDPGLPLRAMGFFKDGDLPSLPKSDQDILRKARDRVSEIPEVAITHGSLAITAAVSHQKQSQ
jgi:hypothetical protein